MMRLVRIVIGLLLVNTACLALVIAAHYSDSAWDCLRFQTTDYFSFGLLDVQHGAYFIERPLVPAKYRSAMTLQAVDYGRNFYYEFRTTTGVRHLGIVGYEHTFDVVDMGLSAGTVQSLYSISSDDKYIALNTYDYQHPAQTMTIYERTTLMPVASVVVESNITHRAATPAISAAPNWSRTNTWFAFISQTPTLLALTLMSPRDGVTQSIPLANKNSLSDILWSPTETAIAVIRDASTSRNAYTKLDMIVLINGRWQLEQSYDATQELSKAGLNNVEWGLENITWQDDGQTLAVIRSEIADEQRQYTLLTFQVGQSTTPTANPLGANAKPVLLTPAWLCTYDTSANNYTVRSLSHAQSSFTLDSSCLDYVSPNRTTLLVKHPSSNRANEWVGMTVNAFDLTPLVLPSGIGNRMLWTYDSRFLIFRTPNAAVTANWNVGYVGLIDTTTWRWIINDQTVDLNLLVTISPDASRFTAWKPLGASLLLLDTNNHLLAELPVATPYSVPNVVGWSADSRFLLLSSFAASNQPIFTVLDRDGNALNTFRQPPQFNQWLGGNFDQSWSHCEPSPKLSRLNLPQ